MNRKLVFTAVGILLIALLIFIFRSCGGGNNVTMELNDTTLTIGDTLKFADKTKGAEQWLWDFGDGSELFAGQSGVHSYSKPGTYKVLLIVNGSDSTARLVHVEGMQIDFEDDKTMLKIEGPSVARVGQPVKFKAITDGARSWQWRFGESGDVDSKEEAPTYTYSAPAKYTVVLNIEGTKNEARHTIIIKPKAIPAGSGVSEGFIKQKLQAISNGGFTIEYNALVDRLCDNQSIPVRVKSNIGKTYEKSLFAYCRELQSLGGTVKIIDVSITKDSDNCVSNITVTQKE